MLFPDRLIVQSVSNVAGHEARLHGFSQYVCQSLRACFWNLGYLQVIDLHGVFSLIGWCASKTRGRCGACSGTCYGVCSVTSGVCGVSFSRSALRSRIGHTAGTALTLTCSPRRPALPDRRFSGHGKIGRGIQLIGFGCMVRQLRRPPLGRQVPLPFPPPIHCVKRRAPYADCIPGYVA